MANVIISIDKEGSATYLVNEHTRDLFPEAAEPRRASHVEPVGFPSLLYFRALRWVFGEDGKVGNWTRAWRGPWCLRIIAAGCPITQCFWTRDEAIEFEINWLNEKF
jgi:hypothetical protein